MMLKLIQNYWDKPEAISKGASTRIMTKILSTTWMVATASKSRKKKRSISSSWATRQTLTASTTVWLRAHHQNTREASTTRMTASEIHPNRKRQNSCLIKTRIVVRVGFKLTQNRAHNPSSSTICSQPSPSIVARKSYCQSPWVSAKSGLRRSEIKPSSTRCSTRTEMRKTPISWRREGRTKTWSEPFEK